MECLHAALVPVDWVEIPDQDGSVDGHVCERVGVSGYRGRASELQRQDVACNWCEGEKIDLPD